MRRLLVVNLLLTAVCLGACGYLIWRNRYQEQRELRGESMDRRLREFHRVRWIGGEYELPRGSDHYGVAVLEFIDGKFLRRREATPWSVPERGRLLQCTIMWGVAPGEPRMSYYDGHGGVGWSGDDFYAKLDGPWGRCVGPDDFGEQMGYRVIGYAASAAFRDDVEESQKGFAGGLEHALQVRKHVLVMGIRSFASTEEAKDWAHNGRE
jgi:hypothetical protein